MWKGIRIYDGKKYPLATPIIHDLSLICHYHRGSPYVIQGLAGDYRCPERQLKVFWGAREVGLMVRSCLSNRVFLSVTQSTLKAHSKCANYHSNTITHRTLKASYIGTSQSTIRVNINSLFLFDSLSKWGGVDTYVIMLAIQLTNTKLITLNHIMNNRTKKLASTLKIRISEKKDTLARCLLNGNDVGASVALTALKRYRKALYTLILIP